MKRFYTTVSTAKATGGYHIMLDGRPVKTAAGAHLCAENEDIATRVMQEWADQGEQIAPDTMLFTQILNTKIDRVSRERTAMRTAVLHYLDTDLLCYFADEPEDLAKMQQAKRGPWLDWFAQVHGCALETTTGLAALTQSPQAHAAVVQYMDALDDAHFTVLQLVTSVSGSLILAMALTRGAASAQQVFDACFTEEIYRETLYEAKKYGPDPTTHKAQNTAMRDFQAAEDYVRMLDSG